jgi:cell division transport system ATP-binding protein
MVRLHRVAKRYGENRYALKDVSFDLNRGEFVYVTGMNGAGKTTLLRLLFAIERVTSGAITVNDRDLSSLPKAQIPVYRREVGFVFQDFKLLPDLNLFDNVALPLEIRKMGQGEVQRRVKGVLSLVGLENRAKDFPGSLSGGEQQRVAIARAIVGKPNLLLGDEPTGNLDSRTAREILSLFKEIHQLGTTVLIATHDENLMEEFPARMIELDGGMMVADKPFGWS